MIVTRTPMRISFLGGGSDYPEFFYEHGGAVLATAIDKFCYVGLRDGKVWSLFDLPSRSGMGTSSAYTVGLIKACSNFDNKTIAQVATIIERDKLEGRVGYQDQYICATGGFKLLQFSPSGISEKIVKVDWLNKYLLLFDTSHYRNAGVIVRSQLENLDKNVSVLKEIKEMAYQGEECLSKKDYRGLGKLLDISWSLKRRLSDTMSTDEIDTIYQKALKTGAIGGKLLGAGGGGFMLFLAEPEKHKAIKNAIRLYHVPFKFETEGSKVVYEDSKYDTYKPKKQ